LNSLKKRAGGEKQLTPLRTITQQSRESNKDTAKGIIPFKQKHFQSVNPSTSQSSELYCDLLEAMLNAEPH